MQKFLVIICFLLAGSCAWSQNNNDPDSLLFPLQYKKGTRYIIKTVAGTTHNGFVVNETRDYVTIENRGIHEKMEIRKSDIISAKPFPDRKAIEEDILGENYHASCYLFASSAFEFEEGASVTHNHWLIIQNIDYALSENWALTTNAFAFFPVSLGVKCSYRVGDISHIGANVFGMGNVLNSDANKSFFWGYGAQARYTHGTTNKNFTIAGGVLGLNSQLIYVSPTAPFVNLPFINLGYCNRFNPNLAFVGEGWYLPSTQTFIGGLGIKLVNNEMYSWSFGCYSFLDTYNNTFKINLKSIPIPYIGIGRKFN